MYEDDDYDSVDFNDSRFDDIKAGWPDGGPMPDEKIELEHVFFTGSDFIGNYLGYNPDAGSVYLMGTRKWQEKQHQRRLPTVAQSVSKLSLSTLSTDSRE